MTAAPDTTRVTEVRQTIADLVRAEMERDADPAVDLFDQGITSLAFIRLIARTNDRYGVAVDVTQLDEASIDTLSELVASHLNIQEDGR